MELEDPSPLPSIRISDDLALVDARSWNALLELQEMPTPFMRHEYLLALQQSGSAVADTGWALQLLCLYEGDTLVAACPSYLKSHSYGEYVFDWAWADAYERHGLRYYPKLLCAVPFTPVPGSRLLARSPHHRRLLPVRHHDNPRQRHQRANASDRLLNHRPLGDDGE